VEQWDGVTAADVPEGYPSAGQLARWRTRFGPLDLPLSDRILVVDTERMLASAIDVAFVHLEEEYTLTSTATGCALVSDNEVSSRLPGLQWLATRLTGANVAASMQRLKAFCETRPAP
jgi:hypothetical protein